jgi:hypothetical protein
MEPKKQQAELIVDPSQALMAAMREVLRNSPLSRVQIAERMTELGKSAGIFGGHDELRVSVTRIDAWVAKSKASNQIPLKLLPLFCKATGNNAPLEVYVQAFVGVRLISEEQYQKLLWAEKEIQMRLAKKEAKKLAQTVGI